MNHVTRWLDHKRSRKRCIMFHVENVLTHSGDYSQASDDFRRRRMLEGLTIASCQLASHTDDLSRNRLRYWALCLTRLFRTLHQRDATYITKGTD